MTLINDFGDSKITVKKAELLDALIKNREQHKKDYEESYAGFKITAEEKMNENLQILKNTGKVHLTISLTAPREHTKDYDRVIKMMQMSTADEITITESQFTQYVMDDWNWKTEFVGTTAMYFNKK